MRPYPVELDVTAPERFDRRQLVLRVAIALVIGYLGVSLGWIFGALYLALPVVAAVVISNRGGERYLAETGPGLTRVLRWFIAFYGYMFLLIDRFPVREPYETLELEIYPEGDPTVGTSLLRLLTSIPVAIVLFVLGFIAALLWLVAAVSVLAVTHYPRGIYAYQRGVLRMEARLLAYHASLVESYPPIALDTGREPVGPVPEARAQPPGPEAAAGGGATH